MLTVARWAAFAVLALCAIYVYLRRYGYLQELIEQDGLLNVWFWDARVFADAGEHVANGRNPYLQPGQEIPYLSLPFISAPIVARTLGALYNVFGPHLNAMLQLAHIAAIVFAPLMLSRLFLGKSWSDAAFGYGLFFTGIGAFGVTTFIAGNFGAVLYLAIFAALAHAMTKKNWLWYHLALIVAVQVKFPYALLWIVPVLVNGWSWREARNSVLACLAAALLLAVTSALDPVFLRSWLTALSHQVNVTGDFGFSFFGITSDLLGPDYGAVPYMVHIAICAPLLVFLLLDPTKGPMKAAALVAFAILANPRMKEYDIAFVAIPVSALLLHAFARYAPAPYRASIAVAAVVAVMLVDLKVDRLIADYAYPLTIGLGILSLAVIRQRADAASPVIPVRFFDNRAG